MVCCRRSNCFGVVGVFLSALCIGGCQTSTGTGEAGGVQGDGCPNAVKGLKIECLLDRSYQGPFGGDVGDFPVTRIDTYWTDGGEESPKNCSSVLGTVADEMQDENGDSKDPQDMEQYAEIENRAVRKLDIYVPSDLPTTVKKKVFFWVHGGAWMDSTKEMYAWIPKVFTGIKKWITVIVEYRPVDPSVFPADVCATKEACRRKVAEGTLGFMDKAAWWPDCMNDVANAFFWVTENIAAYGGDPEDIYVAGQSAGGNLVSMLALSPDFASIRPRIRGIVTMSPPSDLYWLAYQSDPLDVHLDPPAPCGLTYISLFNNLFSHCTTAVPRFLDPGGRGESCTRADLASASPTEQIEPDMHDMPDFLVMQGGNGTDSFTDRDMPCLKEDIDNFVRAMQGNGYGDKVTSIVMDGYGHATSVASLEFENAREEPDWTAFGVYDGTCEETYAEICERCAVGLGSEVKMQNITERIINWIECRNPSGC